MRAREIAMTLLVNAGCDLDCYANHYDFAIKDMQTLVENGDEFDQPIEDIARALVEIGNENAKRIPERSGFEFDDWGKWGIGDFYEDTEKELREVLESGDIFDTGWHGFKKEIQSMRIVRDDENTIVEVHAEMDSALEEWDLITDGITEEEAEMLTDEIVEEIRDYLDLNLDYREETTEVKVLPTSASLEDIVKVASELMDECNDTLHESFLFCAGTTLQVLYGNTVSADWIAKRLEELK